MREVLSNIDMESADNALRASLVARQEELRLSDEKLGKQAFGYLKAPRGKVQSLFVGQGPRGRRKPQTINIWELMNLCEAMGLSWVDEIRKAAKASNQKQSPS